MEEATEFLIMHKCIFCNHSIMLYPGIGLNKYDGYCNINHNYQHYIKCDSNNIEFTMFSSPREPYNWSLGLDHVNNFGKFLYMDKHTLEVRFDVYSSISDLLVDTKKYIKFLNF